MSPVADPKDISQALVSPRWTGLLRADATVAQMGTWDPSVLRQSRVIAPIDVQALYVPPGDTTLYVQLPFALTTPDGAPDAPMPEPMAKGTPRAPGVHLHWAPPDALLTGVMEEVPDGTPNRLGLAALPDRWVVLRIVVIKGGTSPIVTGWVLEADTARAVPLAQWPTASASAKPAGKTIAKPELTGAVGGTLNWAGVYDAVTNRLAFHDDLSDLATLAPNGVVDDLATYMIAGWWSDPTLDPLDGVETTTSLQVQLAELQWALISDLEGGDQAGSSAASTAVMRESIGLETATRYPVSNATFSAATLQSNQRSSSETAQRLTDIASPVRPFVNTSSRYVDKAGAIIAAEPRWPRSTMLSGVVHGVPVAGAVVSDQIPNARAVDTVLGVHGDDVAAVLASAGLSSDDAARRDLERVLSAFTGQVLDRIGTPDGLVDVEQQEHEAGFSSMPGGDGPVERLRTGATGAPLTAGRAARSQQGTTATPAKSAPSAPRVKFSSMGGKYADLSSGTMESLHQTTSSWGGAPPQAVPVAEVREVQRPAPRFHWPVDPVVGVRNAKRSLRHRGDGRFSPDGLLQCRWPSQVPTVVEGVIDGRAYIPSLPCGAIPPEVTTLAQNALITDPYIVPWLAQAESARTGTSSTALEARMTAEATLRFGVDGTYDGRTVAFSTAGVTRATGRVASSAPGIVAVQAGDQLRRFSQVKGVDADPVGVTAWSQPWVPLWLEWEAAVERSDRLDGWQLGQVDFSANAALATTPFPPIRGRAPLHTGTAKTLASAIRDWLNVETQRDQENAGEIDDETAEQLADIADAIDTLDIVTASLDGVQNALLGLPDAGMGLTSARNVDGTVSPPAPVSIPQLLLGGFLRLTGARIVDAFGRTLDVLRKPVRVPARADDPDRPESLVLAPRLLRPARWMLRLVDPAIPDNLLIPPTPAEATVDQVDPARMINPVSGFLLPDHIDESLELFDAAGTPLGELLHDAIGGGVLWEIAPGRAGPPDAPPLYELAPNSRHLGLFASALVATDAQTRQGLPAGRREDSALTALLRAIDTTLWSVDAFAQMGSEHIVGLVGRPIAVVRATLRLEIDDDLDELDLSDPVRRAEREAAYAALADRAFRVRLGEITRTDDGLLGFFVNDDYTRLHVVDKVVSALAVESGSNVGQLDQLGSSSGQPASSPITHPYVLAEDEIEVHVGQQLQLTLLMLPRGRVHLTSGILPRKYVELVRDWIQPGLSVMAPSVRVGPVLIDPDKVRLPKVSSFPVDQQWTRRDTPFTWKNDPILSATQTALLPTLPSSVQEGYIRVMPLAADTTGGTT